MALPGPLPLGGIAEVQNLTLSRVSLCTAFERFLHLFKQIFPDHLPCGINELGT
jgi:hypothetical protein